VAADLSTGSFARPRDASAVSPSVVRVQLYVVSRGSATCRASDVHVRRSPPLPRQRSRRRGLAVRRDRRAVASGALRRRRLNRSARATDDGFRAAVHCPSGSARPDGSPTAIICARSTVDSCAPPLYVIDGVVLGLRPTARSITARAARTGSITLRASPRSRSEGSSGRCSASGPGRRGVDTDRHRIASVAGERQENP
jgi:hypothetical protein